MGHGARILAAQDLANVSANSHTRTDRIATGMPLTGFADRRPAALTQRRLQDMATNSAQVAQLQRLGATANAQSQPVQMLPNWANLALGIGGAALGGAALLGAAPALLGIGGALALGAGVKGGYDNAQEHAQEQARAEKAAEKRKLDVGFKRLHAIEQGLLTRLRSMPPEQRRGRAQVEGDLDQVNIERRALIKRTIDGGHELWLPPTIRGADRATARNLWTSISGNAGNIQVDQDDEGFRTNALSDISKLLESQHGRTMLGNLNVPQPGAGGRRINIGPTDGGTDNAPSGTLNDGHVGEGSTVSINYAEPSNNSMGSRGEPIYDPTYIKLGHELGHASHYLNGTDSGAGNVDAANGDPVEEELWTSQEEYNNITQEENPLRRDLGLAPRAYHKGFDDVQRARKILPATMRLGARMRKLDLTRDFVNNHADVVEEAENWLHPTRMWAPVAYRDLDAAIGRAEAAMARLEQTPGVQKIPRKK